MYECTPWVFMHISYIVNVIDLTLDIPPNHLEVTFFVTLFGDNCRCDSSRSTLYTLKVSWESVHGSRSS